MTRAGATQDDELIRLYVESCTVAIVVLVVQTLRIGNHATSISHHGLVM